MRIWAEYANFFREFRRDFHHTGSLLPSSPFLAAALARPLEGPRPPARILEIGPGTGAVTRAIIRRLQPGDRFDAVEINPRFALLLRQRLGQDATLAPHRHQVEVIEAAVEDLPGESVYDFIVSGLPLNNFSVAQVRSIFSAYTRLLHPGGSLTYFEYALVRHLKTPFANRRERRRLFRIGRVMGRYVRAHQVGRERIFINFPPAIVRQLRPKLSPVLVNEANAREPARAPCDPPGPAVS